MHCDYCFHTKGHCDLNITEFLTFLDKLSESVQSLHLILHGGEPLLIGYENLKELLDGTNRLKFEKLALSIQTNGTLLTKEILNLLDEFNVNISVSYDTIIRSARSCTDIQLPDRALPLTVLHNYNIVNAISIYETLKVNQPNKQLCMNLAYSSSNGDSTITPKQYKYYLDLIRHILSDTSDNATTERNLTEYLNKILTKQSSICTNGCRCNWLTVSAEGYLYSCDRTLHLEEDRLMHMSDFTTINRVWLSSNYLEVLKTTSEVHKKCENCLYSNFCTRKCTLDISENHCTLNRLVIDTIIQMILGDEIQNPHYKLGGN